ncbi:MAG TPA: sulfite exporter TauE/SafE family protein [Tepidisphaeraceae bacterium]|nr:sulfite exporter TauE/SafE family protein [Tepidisphaeraceae bacterium]
MNPLTLHLLVGLLIFSSHLVAGITGFGNQIVALPLLALLVGLDAGKCTLVVLGTVMYTILTLRWHGRVNWRELLIVVGLAGVGLVIGMVIVERLNERASELALGVFVLIMGLQGLLRPALLKVVPNAVAKLLVLGGGIIHGAFTTGGPLLVIYAQRAMPEKGEFRATLGVMWLALNAGPMSGWTITGSWSPRTPTLCLVGMPFLLAGLSIGEYLHHKLDGPPFRAFVNVVLIFNGLVLILFAG